MQIRYEQDIVAWAHGQAKLLREGRLDALDLEHLAEEIETMSASEKRELKNRFAALLQHLLKWEFQPDYRSRSWEAAMLEQRTAINGVLADRPSLRSALADSFTDAYPLALRFAAKETGLEKYLFPKVSADTLDEVLTETGCRRRRANFAVKQDIQAIFGAGLGRSSLCVAGVSKNSWGNLSIRPNTVRLIYFMR